MKPNITMAEVIASHKGTFFFSPFAMRLFRSRLPLYAYKYHNTWSNDTSVFFITSEKSGKLSRRWTIRYLQEDGTIHNWGAFMEYNSRRDAMKDLQNLLAK